MQLIQKFLGKALQKRLLEDPGFAQHLRDRARDKATEPDAETVEQTLQSTEHILHEALGSSADPAMQDALRQLLKDRTTQGGN